MEVAVGIGRQRLHAAAGSVQCGHAARENLEGGGAPALGKLLQEHPERAIEFAVKGMLPKNTLGRAQLSKLKVYRGAEHPHQAQKPQPFEISQVAQ